MALLDAVLHSWAEMNLAKLAASKPGTVVTHHTYASKAGEFILDSLIRICIFASTGFQNKRVLAGETR